MVKTLMWVMVAVAAGMVASGACMYAGWRMAGSPGMGDLKVIPVAWKRMGAGNGAEGMEQADLAVVDAATGAERRVVASAPIEADENLYQQYMARRDVLVMVEYYADW